MAKSANHLKAHRFKKGQTGNPDGARLHDPLVKAFKNLTKDEMMEIGTLVLKGSIDELKQVSKNPKTTVLKAMLAAVAVRTISKGDPGALEVLLNRLIGKVRDDIHHTGLPAAAQPTVIILPAKKTKSDGGS